MGSKAKAKAKANLDAEATLDPHRPFALEVTADAPERLLSIYGIGRQLLEKKEPLEVVRTIHRALVKHLKPDHACVLALESDDAYLPLASHALDLEKPQKEWAISRTVCRKVRRTGLAMLTSDAQDEVDLRDSSSIHHLAIRSIICVPLGSPVSGLIYIHNRAESRRFRRQDLEFVTALSIYTTLVLDRAEEHERTFAALKASDERLELLQQELLRYEVVGKSPKLLAAYDKLRRFARAGARVLLRGETGTGKELFARAYADNSDRKGRPYVPVPIPALTPSLIESELFGHVKGAFSEARQDKKGRLEVAQGGVLFLDEVGDIDLALQPKLLRFLDSGELYRVGDTQPRFVDTLVVSATNLPLEKMVSEDRFRADLLARLGQVVEIPPLRERRGDIPLLVESFSKMYDRGPKRKRFSDEAMEAMKSYKWELNVRQLQQVVQRAICLVDSELIGPTDLPDYISSARDSSGEASSGGDGAPRPLKDVLEEVERAHIQRALAFTKGNRRKAIELLGVSPDTFYKRLSRFGIG